MLSPDCSHYPPSPTDSAYSASLPYYPLHHHTPSQTKPRPRIDVANPYARISATVKRRKIWNHALEKSLFSPYELSTLGALDRRAIYTASLEAHIDRLHTQLLDIGFWPVAFSELEPFKGLNSKTAKSRVAALQHDVSLAKLKLLELERANDVLQNALQGHDAADLSLPDTQLYYP